MFRVPEVLAERRHVHAERIDADLVTEPPREPPVAGVAPAKLLPLDETVANHSDERRVRFLHVVDVAYPTSVVGPHLVDEVEVPAGRIAPSLIGAEPRDAVVAARRQARSRLPDRQNPEGQLQDGQEDRHPDQG